MTRDISITPPSIRVNYPHHIRKKHVNRSHHTEFWSHRKMVPSHHLWCEHNLFQHIFLITPFDAWSHQLGLGWPTITCDQIVNCWSHHKTFSSHRSIVLLLFLQKQNLATAIYLFGLGTLLTGLGLKHMRICSHHDLVGALVTSLFLGRPWWSTTSPTCLPLSVFTITSDQHRCRIPPLL